MGRLLILAIPFLFGIYLGAHYFHEASETPDTMEGAVGSAILSMLYATVLVVVVLPLCVISSAMAFYWYKRSIRSALLVGSYSGLLVLCTSFLWIARIP